MSKVVYKYCLGKGTFSTVYFGLDYDHCAAAKVFDKGHLQDELTNLRRRAAKESLFLRALEHPNIIPGGKSQVTMCARKLPIVWMEPASCNLRQLILKQTTLLLENYDEKRIMDPTNPQSISKIGIVHDCCRGLSYLHSDYPGFHTILHRDIKPDNILIRKRARDEQWIAVLSDFESAHGTGFTEDEIEMLKRAGADQETTDAVNDPTNYPNEYHTAGFMAPELLDRSETGTIICNRKYTKATDVFAMGCIAYFVLSDGGHPFGNDSSKWNEKILNNNYDEFKYDVSNICVYSLTRCMISHRPEDRPPMDAIIEPLSGSTRCHPTFWSKNDQLFFLFDVFTHANDLKIRKNNFLRQSERARKSGTHVVSPALSDEEKGWIMSFEEKLEQGKKVVMKDNNSWINSLVFEDYCKKLNKTQPLGKKLRDKLIRRIVDSDFAQYNSVFSMVRAVRNEIAHGLNKPGDKFYGETINDFMVYMDKTYPRLIPQCYVAAQYLQPFLREKYYLSSEFKFPPLEPVAQEEVESLELDISNLIASTRAMVEAEKLKLNELKNAQSVAK